MNQFRAGSAVAACPLFQTEGGGAIPTSALQLEVKRCDKRLAVELNRRWHSRLPEIGNWQACDAFLCEYSEYIFAVALWSKPVSISLNGRNWYELRRMAVSDDAPKNTPSRFLSLMTRMIRTEHPDIVKLISYQDTGVHSGIIYKASGWIPASVSRDASWNRPNQGRFRSGPQAPTPKVRWEKDLS